MQQQRDCMHGPCTAVGPTHACHCSTRLSHVCRSAPHHTARTLWRRGNDTRSGNAVMQDDRAHSAAQGVVITLPPSTSACQAVLLMARAPPLTAQPAEQLAASTAASGASDSEDPLLQSAQGMPHPGPAPNLAVHIRDGWGCESHAAPAPPGIDVMQHSRPFPQLCELAQARRSRDVPVG